MSGNLVAGRSGNPVAAVVAVVGNSSIVVAVAVVVAHTVANIVANIAVVGIVGTVAVVELVESVVGPVVAVPSDRVPVVSVRKHSKQQRRPCNHHKHKMVDGKLASS